MSALTKITITVSTKEAINLMQGTVSSNVQKQIVNAFKGEKKYPVGASQSVASRVTKKKPTKPVTEATPATTN